MLLELSLSSHRELHLTPLSSVPKLPQKSSYQGPSLLHGVSLLGWIDTLMVLMCVPLLVSMVDVLVSVAGPLTTKRRSLSTVGGKLFIDSVVVNGVQVEPYISSEPGQ